MLRECISEIEDKWMQAVSQFVKNKFSSIWLPSHGHLHHLRVWNFSKDLLTELENAGFDISENLCKMVFFASFFHDTGMIHTIKKEHGMYSKRILEDFLDKRNIKTDEEWNEVFFAIEKHDDKTYRNDHFSEFKPEVYKILSVADDLDAYGALGAYRYFEIYYMRGLRKELLLRNILNNIKDRYSFFSMQLSFLAEYFQVHKARYEFTVDFFQKLYKEMEDASFNCRRKAGDSIVIYNFFEECIEKKQYFVNFIDNITLNRNEYAGHFFKTLKKEILQSNL